MPSSSFGPLVEPGWPSTLPKGPDLGHAFLSAFAIGSQVNARQRSLENQLAMMSLREKQMEYNQQHREDMYNLAVQKMENQNIFQARRLELAAEDNALDRKKYEFAFNKVLDQQEAKEGLINAQATLAAEGLKFGDKGYIERFNQLTAPFIGRVPNNTLNAFMRMIYNNHNGAATQQQRFYDSEYKHFIDDAASTLYGNDNPPNPDLTPILHPEMYQVQKEKVSGNWWSGYEYKNTDRKIIPYTDKVGQPKQREVKISDIDRLNKRYQELMKMKDNLAPKVDDPDLGVSSKTLTERAQQALNDPSASEEAKAAARKILNQ